MPTGNETTAKFKVDISELKKGIQDANRQIKLANAEFKAASAGLDNWAKSADGLNAKITQSEKVLKSQKTILSSYEKQLELVEKEYGKYSKEADEMRIKVENQRAAVAKTEKSVRDYTKQLSDLEKEEKKAVEAAKAQDTAYAKLSKDITAQEKDLTQLKDKYKAVVLEQGKNSVAAKELAAQIGKLSSELVDNQTKMKETDKAADELDKSFEETDKTVQTVSGGFSVFKGVLADLVASGIKAAINGLKELAATAKESFQEFDKGRDAIVKLTGATGENADDLMRAYNNVAKTVNADLTTIGNAVGEVATRFGVSGDRLEELSSRFVKFAKINETDVISSVDDVQKAMSAYGVSADKTEDFLDRLTKTTQDTGVKTSSLTKGIISNATAFQELGLGVDEAVALMGQLEKSGANSETVLNGMRKALKNATKEGKPLEKVLADLQDEIKSNSKSVDGLQAAYDVFGKSGDQIFGAIRNGTLDFKRLSDAAVDASGAVETTFEGTQDAADKVKLAFQSVRVTIGETVDKVLKQYEPEIENAINAVVPIVENVVSWIAQNVPPAIEEIKAFFEQLAPLAQGLYDAFMPVIREVFDKLGKIIKSVFGWIVENGDLVISILSGIGAAMLAWNIASVVSGVIQLVKAIKLMGASAAFAAAKQWLLNTALLANPIGLIVAAVAGLVAAFIVLWKRSEKFRNFWINLWKTVTEKAQAAWEFIKTTFSALGKFFAGIWNGIKNTAAALWSGVVKYFTDAANRIKAIWNGFEKIFAAIWNGIKPVVEFFKSAFLIIAELAQGCWKAVEAVWSAVSEWFNEHVIDPIVKRYTALLETIKTAAKTAWSAVKAVWNVVSSWFSSTVIEPVSKWFSGMWDKLKKGASDAWEGVKQAFGHVADWFYDKFSAAWQKVKDVFSTGGKIFDGIKEGIVSAFKIVVNGIIRGINKVISIPFNQINDILDKLQGLSIAGVNPFSDLVHRLPIPQIPELEQGGVLKRGQVGLLEGNGAEAVVPLERNKAWIAATAAQLKRSLIAEGVLGGSGGSAAPVVNNYFTQNNNSPKALSRLEIYRQSKNLLSMKAVT